MEIYLGIEEIREMINKFLLEKKRSKEELAQNLRITVKELELLFTKKADLALIPKISFPLIGLYCETKFDYQQNEKKK